MQHIVELAQLVAAEAEARLILALHPDARASEMGREPFQRLERRRQLREAEPGGAGEGGGGGGGGGVGGGPFPSRRGGGVRRPGPKSPPPPSPPRHARAAEPTRQLPGMGG